MHPKMPGPDMIKPYLAYPGLAERDARVFRGSEPSRHAPHIERSFRAIFQAEDYPRPPGRGAARCWLWRMDSRLPRKRNRTASAEFYVGYKKTPAQCCRDNFYVTLSGMYWEPVLRLVCAVLTPAGSCSPRITLMNGSRKPPRFMDSVDIDADDKENICHANAERLLRLM